jgi:hypothetical protein
MNALRIVLAAALLCAAPQLRAVPINKCDGYESRSARCKTCEHCWYCGRDKGREGNTAFCARRAEEAAKRRQCQLQSQSQR